jgi:hypothetical protein
MGIINTHSRSARAQLLKMHRLIEFEKAFTAYLEGRVTAAYVTTRVKKMLEVGLPNKLK